MSRITSGVFPGPAGDLEFILNQPDPAETPACGFRRAALVCHPHPLFGGTMNTRIVFHANLALMRMGMPVLRFNFRGVGRSHGVYDHGNGEQADLAAALEYLRGLFPFPVVLAGFSFGATMVAKTLAAAAHPEIERAVLLGLPVDRGEIPSQWIWQGPKIMISGDHDEFASVAALDKFFAALPPPKQHHWLPGGDHFLAGHMDAFRQALTRLLDADLRQRPSCFGSKQDRRSRSGVAY